jgi:hypothetical protein
MKRRDFILVAAQAGELGSVAGGAGGAIKVQLSEAAGMAVQEVGGMVLWAGLEDRGMAIGATEGSVDLVVAHEAVFHVREVLLGGRGGGLFQAAMAGLAGVLSGGEMVAKLGNINFIGRAKVFAVVDGGTNQRGEIGELQVEGMVEVLEDLTLALGTEADGILLGGMAGEALDAGGECLLMREAGLRLKAGREGERD